MKTISSEYKTQDFAILVKYTRTSNGASKTTLSSKRFKKRIILSWDYEVGGITLDQCAKHLLGNNIDVISYSDLDPDYVVLISWDDGLKLFNIGGEK